MKAEAANVSITFDSAPTVARDGGDEATCLWEGKVRHRRRAPRPHAFRHALYLAGLDGDDPEELCRRSWLWSARRPAPVRYRREDYLAPRELGLGDAARQLVEREHGERPRGKVLVLTHLRHYGHVFNPVSFYLLHDERGDLRAVVAEITNTPWFERRAYCLHVKDAQRRGRSWRWRFKKDFHVSPFLPMDMDYDWLVATPPGRVVVHMENRRGGELVFDATLCLRRKPATGPNLALALVRHPWITGKVVAAIHWHALRLWLKRIPFFEHPKWHRPSSATP
ncbi:MAG: DUF1365 domain-containing protein [Planctomycetia bacterium]